MTARVDDYSGATLDRLPTEGDESAAALEIGPIARQRLQTEILARAEALPSPPDILGVLQEKVRDDNVEVSEIEGLLRQDPALVAKLLKLVNSSFFALRYKVNNVSHAVVLLGFRTLRSLIFAAFADEVYRHEMPGYGYARRGLWRHSVRCAFTARMLALREVVERTFAEDLFVAGLLHDLGKLLLWPTVRQRQAEFERALEASDHNVVKTERLVCGMTHGEAGAMVAERWKLAPMLVEAIRWHHEPNADLLFPRQTSAVHLTDWILNELRVGLLPKWPRSVGILRNAVDLLDLDEGAINDLKCWLAQTGSQDAIDE